MRRMAGFLLLAFMILLCGCSEPDIVFFEEGDGWKEVVSPSGVVYEYLCHEGAPYVYLGELEHLGYVEGESVVLAHLTSVTPTGMYAIKGDETQNILIRILPDSEWYCIYRKASLPPLDFSVESWEKIEFFNERPYAQNHQMDGKYHVSISDPNEIEAFFSLDGVEGAPSSSELYSLVKKPDGSYRNCITFGAIYAFHKEEPYLAHRLGVTSYNGLAYSASSLEYWIVLTDEWIQKLNIADAK